MTPTAKKKKYGIHHKRPGFVVYLSLEEREEIATAARMLAERDGMGENDVRISAFIRRATLKEARSILRTEKA